MNPAVGLRRSGKLRHMGDGFYRNRAYLGKWAWFCRVMGWRTAYRSTSYQSFEKVQTLSMEKCTWQGPVRGFQNLWRNHLGTTVVLCEKESRRGREYYKSALLYSCIVRLLKNRKVYFWKPNRPCIIFFIVLKCSQVEMRLVAVIGILHISMSFLPMAFATNALWCEDSRCALKSDTLDFGCRKIDNTFPIAWKLEGYSNKSPSMPSFCGVYINVTAFGFAGRFTPNTHFVEIRNCSACEGMAFGAAALEGCLEVQVM